MKYLRQPGLSNLEVRAVQLAEMSDPLAGLNSSIDSEAFRFDPIGYMKKIEKYGGRGSIRCRATIQSAGAPATTQSFG